MVLRRQAVHRPKQLDAGPFAADVASFRLHLAAENKAPGTVRTYAEAALWFAAGHLLRETDKASWHQVEARDVQRWTVRLLSLYSDAYARNQFRALQQFFRWLAAEDGIGDPMARLRPPRETPKPVPCFTSVELSKLRLRPPGRAGAVAAGPGHRGYPSGERRPRPRPRPGRCGG
jgi:integrase/recombinase XerD